MSDLKGKAKGRRFGATIGAAVGSFLAPIKLNPKRKTSNKHQRKLLKQVES